MSKGFTQEEFIERCKKVHGNKYDYSKTVYNGMQNRVNVICPVHGEFFQYALYHSKGGNCPKCRKITFEMFVDKAEKTHNSKYNYYKETFNGMIKKTKIYCTTCDKDFWQKPTRHINEKQGCPFCANNIKYTEKDVIKRIENKFPNKFTFEKTKYTKINKPIIITCKKHGDFATTYQNIINTSNGCPKCSYEKQSEYRVANNDYFINKSKSLYGDRYDYSKVNYTGHDSHVILKCNICQTSFEVRVRSHYMGNGGCPTCNFSSGEQKIKEFCNNYNIKYQPQKKFKNCKNKLGLTFDFYFPDYNLCIEYDGKQHHQPIPFFGGEEHYQYRKKLDLIKTKYCEENNIDLLRIPYWEKENIEQILINKLSLIR